MAILQEEVIAARLAKSPGWRVERGALVRELTFATFAQAIEFVNRVADLAEQNQHHPEITIRYKGVRLELVTHDEGGITERDLAMVGLLCDGVEV